MQSSELEVGRDACGMVGPNGIGILREGKGMNMKSTGGSKQEHITSRENKEGDGVE